MISNIVMKYWAKTIEFVALNLLCAENGSMSHSTAIKLVNKTYDSSTVVTAKDTGTRNFGRGYACSRYTTSAPDRSGNMLANSVYTDSPAVQMSGVVG